MQRRRGQPRLFFNVVLCFFALLKNILFDNIEYNKIVIFVALLSAEACLKGEWTVGATLHIN